MYKIKVFVSTKEAALTEEEFGVWSNKIIKSALNQVEEFINEKGIVPISISSESGFGLVTLLYSKEDDKP